MDERRVHLFCEDLGHERFLRAVIERMASKEGIPIRITTGSAAGGHGRALSELRTHQRVIVVAAGTPDLLTVAIDANCEGWSKARSNISESIDTRIFPAHVLAVPDPHIERWYLSDPKALWEALEVNVVLGRRKCDRDEYKRLLVSSLREAGHPVTLGGAEFAKEIVSAMDFFQAGKNEPSLRHFLDEVQGVMRSWKHQ